MSAISDSGELIRFQAREASKIPEPVCAKALGLQIGERWIFRDLNFVFKPGELSVLKGSSGTGKTSLIRVLSGVLKPTEGSVICKNLFQPAALSVIHQDLCLSSQLSALTNVMTGRLSRLGWWRSLFGFNSSWASEAFSVLKTLGLEKQALQLTASLSGGEKQRVAVARSLFQEAPIMLADEPVSSMDCEMAAHVVARLKREAVEKNRVVICALHQEFLIDRFADQVLEFESK